MPPCVALRAALCVCVCVFVCARVPRLTSPRAQAGRGAAARAERPGGAERGEADVDEDAAASRLSAVLAGEDETEGCDDARDAARFGRKALLYIHHCLCGVRFPNDELLRSNEQRQRARAAPRPDEPAGDESDASDDEGAVDEDIGEERMTTLRPQLLFFLLTRELRPAAVDDASADSPRAAPYPYLRLLLLLDARATFGVLSLALDAPVARDEAGSTASVRFADEPGVVDDDDDSAESWNPCDPPPPASPSDDSPVARRPHNPVRAAADLRTSVCPSRRYILRVLSQIVLGGDGERGGSGQPLPKPAVAAFFEFVAHFASTQTLRPSAVLASRALEHLLRKPRPPLPGSGAPEPCGDTERRRLLHAREIVQVAGLIGFFGCPAPRGAAPIDAEPSDAAGREAADAAGREAAEGEATARASDASSAEHEDDSQASSEQLHERLSRMLALAEHSSRWRAALLLHDAAWRTCRDAGPETDRVPHTETVDPTEPLTDGSVAVAASFEQRRRARMQARVQLGAAEHFGGAIRSYLRDDADSGFRLAVFSYIKDELSRARRAVDEARCRVTKLTAEAGFVEDSSGELDSTAVAAATEGARDARSSEHAAEHAHECIEECVLAHSGSLVALDAHATARLFAEVGVYMPIPHRERFLADTSLPHSRQVLPESLAGALAALAPMPQRQYALLSAVDRSVEGIGGDTDECADEPHDGGDDDAPFTTRDTAQYTRDGELDPRGFKMAAGGSVTELGRAHGSGAPSPAERRRCALFGARARAHSADVLLASLSVPTSSPKPATASLVPLRMSLDQRQLYLRLMATYDAHAVYPRLVRASKWTRKRRGGGGDGVDAVAGMDGDDLSFGPLDACLAICRRHGIADASAHLLEMRGDARGALDEVRRALARARAARAGARGARLG